MKAKSAPNYAVPALEKGLDILELLSSTAEPLTQTQIGKALKRNFSEIFRMLNLLEERRYVIKDPNTGAYRLSLRLHQLAHAHSPVEQLIQAASGPMHALTRELSESCHLSVLDDTALVVVHIANSPAKVRLSVETGGCFSPLQTASGRLLISYLAKIPRQNLLNALPEWKRLDASRRRKTLDEWNVIRERGYAMANDETLSGVLDVVVPVGNPETGPHAALAVSTLNPSDKPKNAERILARLKQCAGTINHLIGVADHE